MLINKNIHNEEIHFVDGSRQTIRNVVFSEKGEWWHKKTKEGGYYIINPDKILFVKINEVPG